MRGLTAAQVSAFKLFVELVPGLFLLFSRDAADVWGRRLSLDRMTGERSRGAASGVRHAMTTNKVDDDDDHRRASLAVGATTLSCRPK